MKKKIFILLIVLIMIFIPLYRVEAKTLGDLKKELSNLEAKYEENKENKKLTDEQISSLTSEINTLTGKINSIKSEIKKAEEDIADNQKKIEEKKDETDELLKFLQVSSGENVYLEYIFEAESYTDFIYRYSVVSQLTEYNDNLMNGRIPKITIAKIDTTPKIRVTLLMFSRVLVRCFLLNSSSVNKIRCSVLVNSFDSLTSSFFAIYILRSF